MYNLLNKLSYRHQRANVESFCELSFVCVIERSSLKIKHGSTNPFYFLFFLFFHCEKYLFWEDFKN